MNEDRGSLQHFKWDILVFVIFKALIGLVNTLCDFFILFNFIYLD